MTAETHDSRDLDRRSRQVRVLAQEITVMLAHRPGAVAPGELDDALALLDRLSRACPLIQYADADQQLDIAESFLTNWKTMLSEQADLLDQADACWADPDDVER